MQTFLKRIGIFTLCFLILVTIAQSVISLYIKDKSLTEHDNIHQTVDINADLVFLGSSRCTTHFDPLFFDSTYHLTSVNLGVDGHSTLSMAMLRLQTYLLNNKAPRYVFLNLDPLMHAGSATNNTDLVHKHLYARYAFLPGNTEKGLVDYFHFNFVEKYVPLYTIMKYQLLGSCFSAGNFKYTRTWYDKHASAADLVYSAEADNIKQYYRLPKESAAVKLALDQFNRFCISNKIQLFCIQTPVYKLIYDQRAFSEPQKICNELGIRFLDVNGETTIGESKENFFNADHMNINGVRKMNEFLRSRLPAL